MYKKISFSRFVDEFEKMGRGNQFTRAGLKRIFEFYEQLEDETGEVTELDVVAICCTYSEYESKQEILESYRNEINYFEELEDYTTVMQAENGNYIIQNF